MDYQVRISVVRGKDEDEVSRAFAYSELTDYNEAIASMIETLEREE